MDLQQNITENPTSSPAKTKELPKWRLYIMRGHYIITFVGLTFDSWSTFFSPDKQMDTLSGVAYSFWASFALLMGIGVRFPIKMIPLLLLQLVYKSMWIIMTYLPAKSAGLLNESLESFFWICVVAIIVDLIVIPWSYVFKNYISNFFKFK